MLCIANNYAHNIKFLQVSTNLYRTIEHSPCKNRVCTLAQLSEVTLGTLGFGLALICRDRGQRSQTSELASQILHNWVGCH